MKRIVALSIAMVFILSACIPGFSPQQPAAPAVDIQATDQVLAATLVMETLNALPTPTMPVTDTLEPTATLTETVTPTESATDTATETVTGTPPTATASITGTVQTATETMTGTPPTTTASPSGTPPSSTPSAPPTATETLHPRFYGTLPPSIPYGSITLINKARTEVYVSLQCTTIDGYTTIIEYPVEGKMSISAPLGSYTYVAWVGGRKYQGWFRLNKGNVEIIFDKTKVIIN